MAIVHSDPHRDITLLSYGARVAFAVAVVVTGLKIMIDQWPCDIAPIGSCPRIALHASATPP
jgi:hypothetical protein